MTNNDNCIRTLLNTSLASKSPKIFPMGHTRESLDIHIFTPFYLHRFWYLQNHGVFNYFLDCTSLTHEMLILSYNMYRLVEDSVLSHNRFSLIRHTWLFSTFFTQLNYFSTVTLSLWQSLNVTKNKFQDKLAASSVISSNANSTLPSAIPSSVTTDTSSYLAKTEPKMEEIDSELNATTGYGRSSNQVGSPSSSSPVVSQQSVIQTSPSLENSISQGHQSSPVVPLTPEAPVVTVRYCKVLNMSHNNVF